MDQLADLANQLRSNPGREVDIATAFVKDLNRRYAATAPLALAALQDIQRADIPGALKRLEARRKVMGGDRASTPIAKAMATGPLTASVLRSLDGGRTADENAAALAVCDREEILETISKAHSHAEAAAIHQRFENARAEIRQAAFNAALQPSRARL